MRILAIDIGGTGIKAAVLNASGKMLTERVRVDTPHPCGPAVLVKSIAALVRPLPAAACVSVGFPGVVRNGKTLPAPMLGNDLWRNFDLARALQKRLGLPVRVLNDADLQGLAAIKGRGVEMVVTLGTGFGSALFHDGKLGPHLELSVSQFEGGETYNERLGNATLHRIGKKRWNKRVARAIVALRTLTNFDHLYIGGGNGERIKFDLDPDVEIIPNEDGIRGGATIWRGPEFQPAIKPKARAAGGTSKAGATKQNPERKRRAKPRPR